MIPYNEMVTYYRNIINNIYHEITDDTPIEYGEGFCDITYPPEYTEAYGWLQRAEWRLSETTEMSDYYNEETFKYYGIHNLSNVQHRIISYLNETNFNFSEKVTDCHKYDKYIELNKEIIKDYDTFNKWFDYYSKLHSMKSIKETIELHIRGIKQDLEILEDTCQDYSEKITNSDELSSILSELNNLINNFKPVYELIES